MFQFSCRFDFSINFSSLKMDTKIKRILMLHQANTPTLTRCNFLWNIHLSSQYLAHIICRHLNIIHSSKITVHAVFVI